MNKQNWDLYKSTKRGQKTIALFEPEQQNAFDAMEAMLNEAKQWGCDFQIEPTLQTVDCFYVNIAERGLLVGDLNRDTFADFIASYDILFPYEDEDGNVQFLTDRHNTFIKANDYRKKASSTHILSLCFYYFVGDLFFPILLPHRHDIFSERCSVLGIELPPVPRTKDHQQYCLYYYDLCKAIAEFRDEYNLTDAETCACIYDYASTLIDDDKNIPNLPSPTNVWLTGASGDDFKYLDALGNNCEEYNPSNIWACNERTRRGDIVVICCLSPRSSIHSIWRASTGGIFNPFDYYHCRTTVCNGMIIPPIKTSEMKADPYFSQVPIVRKNFQGINGWELTAKDYSELLRMIEERGGNIENLPRLFDGSIVDFGSLDIEKDVEEKILIPALHRLGYTSENWTRQLALKAGRKEKAIPDFVFFPHGEHHFENAPMVIEAKYDMSSMVEFNNAYRQALSYARMLQSAIFAVCDKERLVVYRTGKGCTIDNPTYENHWATIFADETEGAALKQIIGREVVTSL